MKVTFLEYMGPIVMAFICGALASILASEPMGWLIYIPLVIFTVTFQLYVLDKRDPNGLWAMMEREKRRGK